jgi:hypothetical protein
MDGIRQECEMTSRCMVKIKTERQAKKHYEMKGMKD